MVRENRCGEAFVIVAITGGTGYVGSRLVATHLARGDRLRLLTRRPPKARPELAGDVVWCQGDLGDPGVRLIPFVEGADLLHHCAAELRSVEAMQAVNQEGTRRLLYAASGRVGRWVQLSSVGVYGPRSEGMVTEDTPFAPHGPYEVTKAWADSAVQEAHAAGRIRASIVRPSIVFGHGMPNNSLRQWTAMIRRGLFFFIGPEGALTHYVPVQSVVEALVLCGSQDAAVGEAFNLSEDAPIEQFVGWIAQECRVKTPRRRIPRLPAKVAAGLFDWIPGWPLTRSRVVALTNRASYPRSRIEAVLEFRPALDLEAAVRAAVVSFANLDQ